MNQQDKARQVVPGVVPLVAVVVTRQTRTRRWQF